MINLQTVFPEMPPTTYILTDVINHHGDGVNRGHYTETNIEQSRCFDGLRNPKFDLVDAASCDKYKKTGYIFFYKRLDLPEQGASGDSLSNLDPLTPMHNATRDQPMNLSTPDKSCRDVVSEADMEDYIQEVATSKSAEPKTPQQMRNATRKLLQTPSPTSKRLGEEFTPKSSSPKMKWRRLYMSTGELQTIPEKDRDVPEECPMESGDMENNVPHQTQDETPINVHVHRGSAEDLIFMVNDVDDIRKGKSFWKDKGNLFIIIEMKRVVWLRYSVKMTLRSLKDRLFLLYPDITLVTPIFNANNRELDLDADIGDVKEQCLMLSNTIVENYPGKLWCCISESCKGTDGMMKGFTLRTNFDNNKKHKKTSACKLFLPDVLHDGKKVYGKNMDHSTDPEYIYGRPKAFRSTMPPKAVKPPKAAKPPKAVIPTSEQPSTATKTVAKSNEKIPPTMTLPCTCSNTWHTCRTCGKKTCSAPSCAVLDEEDENKRQCLPCAGQNNRPSVDDVVVAVRAKQTQLLGQNNKPSVDDVVNAVRAEQTQRPKRKTKRRIEKLFLDNDSEPEPEYDSDAANDKEYTEHDALKEAGKKSWDDESCEEEDEFDEIAPRVSTSNPSKMKEKKETITPLPYTPAEGIAEICLDYRERRLEDMIEELQVFDEETAEIEWAPTEADEEEIEKTVLSRVLTECKGYAQGQWTISNESKRLMAIGKLPKRMLDRQHVPQTYYDYRRATHMVLESICKHLKRDIHMADFWKFGTVEIINPLQNIHLWLAEDVPQPAVRQWCLSCYEKILSAQSVKALESVEAFRNLVPNIDQLTPVLQQHHAKKEAQAFVSECYNLKNKLSAMGVHKKLQLDRNAKHAQNRKDVEEHEGHVVPDALTALPAYFNDPTTKALTAELVDAACNENKVIAGNWLVKMHEHVIVTLSIKNPHRIEVWFNMTKQEFYLAMKGIFYPYKTATEEDLASGDKDVQDDGSALYRYSKDLTPDDDMDSETKDLLTGIIVTVAAHKTGFKGSAEVWLSKSDQILIRSLIEVTDRYAKKIGKEYGLESPLFVNKNLDPFRSTRGKRAVNFGRYAKIAGVARYKSHDSRHVWSDALADQHDLIFREAVALAANHSVATQQANYISNFTNTMKKAKVQKFYQEKAGVLQRSSSKLEGRTIQLSKGATDRQAEAMMQAVENSRNEYLYRLSQEQNMRKMSKGSVITEEAKYNFIMMIKKLGHQDVHLNELLGVNLYEHFLTGKPTVNIKTRSLILYLLDFGRSCALNEAEGLYQHLLEYCRMRPKWQRSFRSNKTYDEMANQMELDWTEKLVNVLDNLRNTPTSLQFRLKHVLTELNQESSPQEFRYSFGNENIRNSLQIQAKFYKKQTREAEKLKHGAKDAISASSYIDSLAATTQKLSLEKQQNIDKEHGRLMAEQEEEQQQKMLSQERAAQDNDSAQDTCSNRDELDIGQGSPTTVHFNEPEVVQDTSPHKGYRFAIVWDSQNIYK